ncbi:hypothetical protein [Vibrio harveyi]|uniref:hypothetical protein n=1 Tax=Vibrio harveyi TaxID=669 RepID=UPI000DF447F1|nr:hypothetical protein [Vibrio harveyi]RCR64152.1 hypothetical protein DTW68_06500 [Vibrio harveyi]
MNVKTLNELSLLKTALASEYSNYLTSVSESLLTKKETLRTLNVYAAYCYLVEQSNYTALKILNDSNSFNAHFQLFIGFIYGRADTSLKNKYTLCNQVRKIFNFIAQDKRLSFDEITLSSKKVTEDVSSCLEQFHNHKVDKTKSDYLNGWLLVSKEGKTCEVHLDMLYVIFGENFTNKVHIALKNYGLKQKSSTLRSMLIDMKNLFVGISIVYTEQDGMTIETYLSRKHVQIFFHKVYKVLFVRSQMLQNCPKSFHKKWRNIIGYYIDCFINTGVFAEPHKPFIIPEWKDPRDSAPTFSVGGNPTQTENNRWFANIPLRIKDEEAVSIIQQRVERDIAHVRHVCCLKFEELIEREDRNRAFLNTGRVKPLSPNSSNHQYYNFVGVDKLDNTVATFYSHGINAKPSYLSFLGFAGNAKQLHIELNLPTSSTLNVLLTLLVMEHPLITPSWLARWELFNANGDMVGYKQVGSQYIVVSYKARKGTTNAQQEIVLNEFSKSVVDFLIKHTHMSREYLKNKGNINWRKMLLTATHSNAACPSAINTTLHSANDFYNWLKDESFFSKESNITVADAQAISDIHSLRSIRRHCGLQIYLKTRSMDVVAEALGHEKKDARLLTSYLPKPLMDFFNDRWIRQFQSAILLEAMKDSVYCLDAVNMSADYIDEFLNNHGISHLPEHLDHGFVQQDTTKNKGPESIAFDQLTYVISTPLLQLLMAIRTIVESDDNLPYLDIVSHWYQSAVFILDTLNSGKHSADTDLMEMLCLAVNNKLDTDLVKGALIC